VDAFTQAGFEVIALLNEPSAAGFDLGGGTFDASPAAPPGAAQR